VVNNMDVEKKDKEYLTVGFRTELLDLLELDKDLKALEIQINQNNLTIKSLNSLIKDIKSGKLKNMSEMLGGSLLIPISEPKKLLKGLVGRREQHKTILIGLIEQRGHRIDHFYEIESKGAKYFTAKIKELGLSGD